MADPSPILDPDIKIALRTHARSTRRAFVQMLGPAREAHQDQAGRLLLPLLSEAGRIGFYRAQGAELDPGDVLEAAATVGRTTALPRMASTGAALAFHQWRPGDPLRAGAHGVEEPLAEAPAVVPDVIVLPLLTFDRAGRRLGQGGGYYDRTLAAYPDALRIGFAWSVQEVDEVPVEPWDAVLDAVVTEREWIECR